MTLEIAADEPKLATIIRHCPTKKKKKIKTCEKNVFYNLKQTKQYHNIFYYYISYLIDNKRDLSNFIYAFFPFAIF